MILFGDGSHDKDKITHFIIFGLEVVIAFIKAIKMIVLENRFQIIFSARSCTISSYILLFMR